MDLDRPPDPLGGRDQRDPGQRRGRNRGHAGLRERRAVLRGGERGHRRRRWEADLPDRRGAVHHRQVASSRGHLRRCRDAALRRRRTGRGEPGAVRTDSIRRRRAARDWRLLRSQRGHRTRRSPPFGGDAPPGHRRIRSEATIRSSFGPRRPVSGSRHDAGMGGRALLVLAHDRGDERGRRGDDPRDDVGEGPG